MKKLISQDIYEEDISNGTSSAGITLVASLDRLLDVLGRPTRIGSGDNKVQLTWIYHNINQLKYDDYECITIYDWKAHTPIHDIHEWHVGAKNIDKEEIKEELISQGFFKQEIVDY